MRVSTHSSSPNQPRHPPPSLTAELYASPSASFPLPLCALVPLFSCHLASWCEHMPGACGTVPRPQSTCSNSHSTILLPLLSLVLGLRFLSIYFCFCRFRSTFLMPVKHENAFAIPTFTCISPSLSPLPPVPALYPSLASVAL